MSIILIITQYIQRLILFFQPYFDFYATLGNGGTLIVLTNKEILDPHIVAEFWKNKCNSWFSVPSLISFT